MGLVVYFYITVAEIDSMVHPDGVLDDFRRKPVPLVSIHHRIMGYGRLSCQYHFWELNCQYRLVSTSGSIYELAQ